MSFFEHTRLVSSAVVPVQVLRCPCSTRQVGHADLRWAGWGRARGLAPVGGAPLAENTGGVGVAGDTEGLQAEAGDSCGGEGGVEVLRYPVSESVSLFPYCVRGYGKLFTPCPRARLASRVVHDDRRLASAAGGAPALPAGRVPLAGLPGAR